MAAIVDNALDCIVTIDEAGAIVEFNRAAQSTFGYARAAILHRPMSDLIVPPEMRDQHAAGFRRYMETGQRRMLGRRVETMAWDATGRRFPVELAITEVSLPGTRLFTAHLRDLTRARQLADELERQREVLFQNEKLAALGSLLAGVAHELNNPLSVVVGRATMLAEECEDPGQRDSLDRLSRAAERCARIVHAFLALARQQPRAHVPVAIPEVLRSCLDLLAFGLRSDGISVALEVAPDLPSALGDADQLHQVFANLVVNAQHALREISPPRQLTLRAGPDGVGLRIEVGDNGPGIPPSLRQRIFDPFFTTKPVGQGTGLGLAVCHGIVAEHGGEIIASERPGGGALFTVTLPRAGPVEPAPAKGTAGRIAGPTAGARLLVADDDPEVLDVLSDLLVRDAYQVVRAAGGRDALKQAAVGRFDLVITDLRMPDLDGRGLHRELQQVAPALAARMILITGDSLSADLRSFISSTGLTCLRKPVLAEELRAAVRAALYQDHDRDPGT
jgi:two-component system NtrC family sensor kinase